MTVYFHGSFGLNRERMAGILKIALENPEIRDQAIAEQFGFNAPFTARYRSWLHKTGMIELKYPLMLTEMGQVVYENDPKLETLISQWFLHHELSTDPDRTEAWYFFANEFMPDHRTFSKDELLSGLTEKLRVHSEKHFGPKSTLNKVILRKILECYTKKEALGQLGFISSEKNRYTFNHKIKGPWKSTTDLREAYRPLH